MSCTVATCVTCVLWSRPAHGAAAGPCVCSCSQGCGRSRMWCVHQSRASCCGCVSISDLVPAQSISGMVGQIMWTAFLCRLSSCPSHAPCGSPPEVRLRQVNDAKLRGARESPRYVLRRRLPGCCTRCREDAIPHIRFSRFSADYSALSAVTVDSETSQLVLGHSCVHSCTSAVSALTPHRAGSEPCSGAPLRSPPAALWMSDLSRMWRSSQLDWTSTRRLAK